MEPIVIAVLACVSFLAGFVDSIAGGGGLLLIPSLLIAGMPPQTALGTNKFAGTCGTATALANFAKNGKVLWEIAGFGLAFSLAGSILGTRSILYFDQNTTTKIILTLLPVTAVTVFLPKKESKTSISELSRIQLWLYVPLFSFVLGFYDGFFGPGAGTFLIFGFYMFLGLHLVQASAIAKAFNLSSQIGSLLTFALAGKVLYAVGIPIALANLLGGYAGSALAMKRGHGFIKIFLLLMFVILFITLVTRMWAS